MRRGRNVVWGTEMALLGSFWGYEIGIIVEESAGYRIMHECFATPAHPLYEVCIIAA